MRAYFFALGLASSGCAQAPANAPPVQATETPSPTVSASPARPTAKVAGSPLTDGEPAAFRADFANFALGKEFNLFGGKDGNRQVKGDTEGLLVRIVSGERPWDAVGVRTAKVKVDGDFDLRGRFVDFAVSGNGSAKLIVVDAASSRGEACYVERIQIDGKNLFKFGGEIDGNLENWGFSATDATIGDLRLVRSGDTLHAYARANGETNWNEFAPAQPVPKSMPRVLKFGVKLSADVQKSASVRWVDLTINGHVVPD